MKPAVRTHENFEEAAMLYPGEFEPGVECTPEEDKARQEFGRETEVDFILRKYGALPPVPMGGPIEVDFDLDVLTGLQAMQTVKEGLRRLPVAVRKLYPTPDALLQALQDGKLVLSKETGTLEVPSSGDGSSASDSAAGSAQGGQK